MVPVTELESLAASWQIPLDEVKALVGFATRNDLRLHTESIEEARIDWSASGLDPDQLAAIAEEWNVSTISVKVLQFIGDPDLKASLRSCGL